ncbi:hypothetical protein BKA64DRAFT_641144 [Cadophora sp. MPI-SDFR-AT-0126]|nr:hypothetical protein BKA64DRAFT_641144 [Leotiomycetes sp. MPI-SDFR-AT-0126]
MEIPTIELTSEDLLDFHRYYITCLYLQDKKTDVEIVQHLYEEYKFQVTLTQIQKCIKDWKLELPISPELKPEESKAPDSPSDDSWVVIPSMTAPPALTTNSYTPSDPKLMSHYTKRPLPSLPAPKSNTKMDSKSRVRKRQAPNTDRVRGICHHGAGAFDSHEIETNLSSIPDGPSQIELYVDDDQDYERVAQGLTSMAVAFARAGHHKEGLPRHHSTLRIARRTNKTGKDKRDEGRERERETERQRSTSNETSERDMSHES